MILTEKEAQEKRCTIMAPVLLLDRERLDALAAGGERVGFRCIGSQCMQWSWYDYANAQGETYRRVSAVSYEKGRASGAPGSDAKKCAARGYCGLTGAKE